MKRKIMSKLSLVLMAVLLMSISLPLALAAEGQVDLKVDPVEVGDTSITGRVSAGANVKVTINGTVYEGESIEYDSEHVGWETTTIPALKFGDQIEVEAKKEDSTPAKEEVDVLAATYTLVPRVTYIDSDEDPGSPEIKSLDVDGKTITGTEFKSLDVDGKTITGTEFKSAKTREKLVKTIKNVVLKDPKYYISSVSAEVDPDNDNSILVNIKLQKQVKGVKITFPGKEKGIKIDTNDFSGTSYNFELGETYTITGNPSVAGAKLILDPYKKNPEGLKVDGEKITYDAKPGDKEIFLAFEKAGKIFEGDLNAVVGKHYINAQMVEDALKRGGKDKRTVTSVYETIYATYKDKSVSQDEFLVTDPTSGKPGLKATFTLKDEIEKLYDTVVFRALDADGIYIKQSLMVEKSRIDLELEKLVEGAKEIKGKTESGAEVKITIGEKTYEVTADKKGEFKVSLIKALVAGEEVIIEAKLGENKTTGELKFKVEDAKASLIRLQGSDRYLTAIEVSKKNYQAGSETLIIASGHNTADALAAGVLAVKEDGPILLVKGNLDAPLKTEISRLRPSKIIIVGGENSVSASIEVELATMASSLIRLSGQDRYATSIAIADYLSKNFDTEKIVLAEASRSVDALAVSAYAAKNNLAIVLSPADKLPEVVTKYIDDEDISHVEIVGGPAAISDTIQRSLGDNFKLRISGDNRYLTAIEVAKKAYQNPDKAVLVNGNAGLVDALSAAPYAYKTEAPILLTGPEELNKDTEKYVDENNIFMVSIIGGQNSVSSLVELKVKDLINLEN